MSNFRSHALAVAIGAALTSTAVTAQAAEPNALALPEFYGMLYASLDYTSGGNWRLNSNNSRIGLKQDIALGNGLTAIWKVEIGVKLDDGDFDKDEKEHFIQRDIYAGIKGDFGQVIAGRFNTPLRRTEGKIDPFNHLHGDIEKVLGGQMRVSNMVEYTSPKFANTQIIAAAIIVEEEDNKKLDKNGKKKDETDMAYSLAAVYNNNNLYAALGVDINSLSKIGTDIKSGKDSNNVIRNPNNPDGRSDRAQLALKYQFGAASIGTIVQHARDSEDSQYKENAFIVNSTYRIGDYLLKAQYGLNKGEETKNKRELAAIGVDYLLSKDAFITLDYAEVTIDPKQGTKDTEKVATLGYSVKF